MLARSMQIRMLLVVAYLLALLAHCFSILVICLEGLLFGVDAWSNRYFVACCFYTDHALIQGLVISDKHCCSFTRIYLVLVLSGELLPGHMLVRYYAS